MILKKRTVINHGGPEQRSRDSITALIFRIHAHDERSVHFLEHVEVRQAEFGHGPSAGNRGKLFLSVRIYREI
jgi:hypothetical protein